MKLALVLAAICALMVIPASAGANLPPTTVVVNGDGTVTISTTGDSHWCPPPRNAVGGCELHIYNASGVSSYGASLSEQEVTLQVSNMPPCPCQAQFWEHAGQWKPYSALSEPFTP